VSGSSMVPNNTQIFIVPLCPLNILKWG
jgi:hypothetical protein